MHLLLRWLNFAHVWAGGQCLGRVLHSGILMRIVTRVIDIVLIIADIVIAIRTAFRKLIQCVRIVTE